MVNGYVERDVTRFNAFSKSFKILEITNLGFPSQTSGFGTNPKIFQTMGSLGIYIYIYYLCVRAYLILLCIYIQLILAQFPRKGLPHNKSQEALKICHTWSNHGW